MRTLLLALLLPLILLAAGVPGRGGFEAVAVSPGGKLVAVGGQNRVVYLLDPEKAEVRSRFWLGARIGELAFSKDGARLVVADETDRLHLLDVATGKTLARIANAAGMRALPATNLLVVHDLGDLTRNRLRFLSMETLEEIGLVELPDRPISWKIDASGKKLLALGMGKPGDEPVIPVTEMPRDLRGLARWKFRQKNDGLESILYEVEVPSGKVAATTKSWYTSDSDTTQLARVGSVTYVFNRVNLCAQIGPKGATTMFETSQGVNHALAVSPDGKTLFTAGMGGGMIGPIDGDKRAVFKLDELPGQSEFINRFSVQDDGSAWAVTTAYRLVRISRTGRVEKVTPVY